MEFDFGDNTPSDDHSALIPDSFKKALRIEALPVPTEDVLNKMIKSCEKIKITPQKYVEKLADFLNAQIHGIILNENSVDQFIEHITLEIASELDFISYDRTIDQITSFAKKVNKPSQPHQSTLPTPTTSTTTPTTTMTTISHGLKPHQSPFKSPSTTKRPAYKTITPSTNNPTRSQWTPLLASPSSSFPEHHQKGQTLIRFAPSSHHLNSQKTTQNGSKLHNSTMFDDLDSAPVQSSTRIPIYNLSSIQTAVKQRRAITRDNALYGINTRVPDQSELPPMSRNLDHHDMLKVSKKPFRYMNWDHVAAIQLAQRKEEEIGDALVQSAAFLIDVDGNKDGKGQKMNDGDDNDEEKVENVEKVENIEKVEKVEKVDDSTEITMCNNFSTQQIHDVWYTGHIKNTLSSKDQRLTNSSLVITNYESECVLRLTHKALKHYSFFPGQIIVCRGTNITGNAIIPDLILTETTLGAYKRQQWLQLYWNLVYRLPYKKQQDLLKKTQNESTTITAPITTTQGQNRASLFGESKTHIVTVNTPVQNNIDHKIPSIDELPPVVSSPVKVMYCNGPFVSPKGTTQSISAILDVIFNDVSTPDVLILSGPFVAVESPHSMIRTAPPQINDKLVTNKPDYYNIPDGDKPEQQISLCNVPVYKSDFFSQQIQFSLNQSKNESFSNIPSPNGSHQNIDQDPNQINISSYTELFNDTLNHLISALNANPSTRHMTVITMPSIKDVHHHACFPQPAYNYVYSPLDPRDGNTVRIINVPNPCQIDINGVLFGICSNDIIAELSKYELFTQQSQSSNLLIMSPSTAPNGPNTPSKIQPNDMVQITSADTVPLDSTAPHSPSFGSKLPSHKDKRTVRLVSHILSQQSFAPISTMPANRCLEESSNVRTTLDLLCKPDILLLPSKLRYFIEPVPTPGELSSQRNISDPSEDFLKQNGHVLAINPESTILGEQRGTFAMITLFPPPEGNQHCDIIDRVHAEIIHL